MLGEWTSRVLSQGREGGRWLVFWRSHILDFGGPVWDNEDELLALGDGPSTRETASQLQGGGEGSSSATAITGSGTDSGSRRGVSNIRQFASSFFLSTFVSQLHSFWVSWFPCFFVSLLVFFFFVGNLGEVGHHGHAAAPAFFITHDGG